ncbi:MAG: DUF4268 domain-containing protein [Chitinophagaceae bacterium]
MFSKQEASHLKQQFWTSFGQYMSPIPSSEGAKVNWINYKTGIKDIFFKMDAGNKNATIALVLAQADLQRQEIFYNQLLQLKTALHESLQEDWHWQQQVQDENNKIISRVYIQLDNVNIYNRHDWPSIISFFKPRIIALDAFWAEMRFVFEVV